MKDCSTRIFNQLKKVTNKFGKVEIIKTSSYYEKFYDEVKWLISLPNDLKKYIPNISNFSLSKNSHDNFIQYEYVDYNTIHTQLVDNNNNELFWSGCVNKYKLMITDFLKHKPTPFNLEYWKAQCFSMYIKKTKDRLEQLYLHPKLLTFLKNHDIVINQEQYPSVKSIISEFNQYISKTKSNKIFDQLFENLNERICIVHGDLTFSNVFYSLEFDRILVIDPRGSFGVDKTYGDVLEEYAKVYQSIYGLYDYVISNKFKLDVDNNKFNYSFQFNDNYEIIRRNFDKLFPQNYLNLIKLITSFFLLSMFPFHSENTDHQIMFLCLGIKMFYEVMNNK